MNGDDPARPGLTRHEAGWDEGRASERTVLAWHRSAISLLAIAALVLRAGITGDLLAVAIPLTLLLAISAAGAWWHSVRIYSEHDRPFEEGATLHEAELRALTVVTLITAVAAGVLVLGR
ncbi:MAG: DUF202 domain-containing protein [Solirubrobacteraceae bacterium]